MPLARPILWIVAALVVFQLIAIAWAMNRRTGTGPDAGIRFAGGYPLKRIANGSLRVAQFNIHNGVGTDGLRDIRRIARDLEPFDLVCLNEVDGVESGYNSQANALGELTGRNWLFAVSERRYGKANLGNAILTNLPVDHWSRHPMKKTLPDGYRNFVLLRVRVSGRSVSVIATHTDGSEDRDAQLRIVLGLFTSLQPPVLLMGDLNTRADHPQLKRVLERPDVLEPLRALGHPMREDQIDWILARGFQITAGGATDWGTSDHPMYWANLTLNPSPTTRPTTSPRQP